MNIEDESDDGRTWGGRKPVEMMTHEQRASLAGIFCNDCGGEFLGGELPDCSRTSIGRNRRDSSAWRDDEVYYEFRCRECGENYASALWPDDTWGPYPFTVAPVKQWKPS